MVPQSQNPPMATPVTPVPMQPQNLHQQAQTAEPVLSQIQGQWNFSGLPQNQNSQQPTQMAMPPQSQNLQQPAQVAIPTQNQNPPQNQNPQQPTQTSGTQFTELEQAAISALIPLSIEEDAPLGLKQIYKQMMPVLQSIFQKSIQSAKDIQPLAAKAELAELATINSRIKELTSLGSAYQLGPEF
jgi:hypothetical protein